MRAVAFFVGFLIFGLVLFAIIGNVAVDQTWFRDLGHAAWIIAILLIVSDIAIPIPTTVIITSMGQLYGPWIGGLIGTAGCFLAGLTAFGLTRAVGDRFARWLLGKEWERTRHFFQNSGAFAVACSRWLPLIPEAVSCMAGLARMPFGKYCLALLAGSVPMSFAYAALAQISDNEIIPLVVSIVLPVPIWWFAGRLLYRRTQRSAGA